MHLSGGGSGSGAPNECLYYHRCHGLQKNNHFTNCAKKKRNVLTCFTYHALCVQSLGQVHRFSSVPGNAWDSRE